MSSTGTPRPHSSEGPPQTNSTLPPKDLSPQKCFVLFYVKLALPLHSQVYHYSPASY